jgi:hypothetical protein
VSELQADLDEHDGRRSGQRRRQRRYRFALPWTKASARSPWDQKYTGLATTEDLDDLEEEHLEERNRAESSEFV